MHSDKSTWLLKGLALAGICFLYFPILIILIYAFNTEESAFSFPPKGFTVEWFLKAAERDDIFQALGFSLQIAAISTLIALLLGSLAALALYRNNFPGKNAFTLIMILPIALPGIVTGLSLLSTFKSAGITPGMATITIGHATFCVVIVYNNVVARLRRISFNIVEASYDLGASALQTFWHIILPNLGASLFAGGLLAFALSFDELIVTIFTAGHEPTLPLWLLNQLSRPRDVPITNVVALMVMMMTMLPVLLSYWLTKDR